ncbi:MAG: hypoxic response protein 1 [Candidatus Saccharibacteria bacterium]|nr:hypoxic response protein 1 [Candidatus Saccharibacteria bacterium]
MKYRELIKKIQDYSGFSDNESEDALDLVVETIATRLAPGQRKDFASQLPEELEDIAMRPTIAQQFSADDMLEELCELEDIDRGRAKKQVMAVWRALKDAISPRKIENIRSQLPEDLIQALH